MLRCSKYVVPSSDLSRILVGTMLATLVASPLATGCSSSLTSVRTGASFQDLSYPMATKTAVVDGVEVAYGDFPATGGEAVADGRTLVLIHGLASYMPAWSRNLPELTRRHRVVTIDLPGFGKSSKKNYKYSMEFFARVVDGLLDKLEVRRPVLVGHSMGGQISLTHALLFPRKAEALVLVAPAGLETFAEGEGRWLADASTKELFKSTPPEGVYANFANNFYAMPKEARFMIEDRIRVIGGSDFDAYCYAVSRSVTGMIEGPVAARLGEIEVPILVVYGNEDGLIPNPILHGGETRAVGEQGVAKMKRGELVMIPKAGHMLQFEKPAEVNKAIADFLGRIGAGGAGSGTGDAAAGQAGK